MEILKFITKITNIIGVKDIASRLFPSLKISFLESFHDTTTEYGFDRAKPDPKVIENIKNRIIILSEKSEGKVTGDLRYQILEGIQNNESITDITNRIQTVFSGTRYEAERIARTEVLTSMRAGTEEGLKQSNVPYKKWLAAIHNKRTCKLCKALNGQIVPVGEPFINPFDGTPIISLAHSNCRCTIIGVYKKEEED